MGLFTGIRHLWDRVTGHHPNVQPVEVVHEETPPSFSETAKVLLQAGFEHAEALMEVFQIELNEAVKRAQAKIIWLVVFLLTACFTYIFLWGCIIVLLSWCLNYIWAFGIACVYHLIICLVAGYLFKKTSLSPLIPNTINELKSDYTCLKMTVKGK